MCEVILIEPNIFEVPVHPLFFEYEELLCKFSHKRGLVGFSRGTIVPPTNLISMATYLRNCQISVRIIDLTLWYMMRKEDIVNQTLSLLVSENPRIIGISGVYLSLIPNIKKMALLMKQVLPQSIIVAGGVSASCLRKELLESGGFDFIIRSEGEITFLNLCKELLGSNNLPSVEGTSYLKDGGIVDTKDRNFMNLDDLLIPDRSLFPIKEFYDLNKGIDLVYASRGCPFECTFCSSPVFWKRKWRNRSSEHVVEELKNIEEIGAKIAHIYDANFGVSEEWVNEICKRIKENGLHVFWDCSMRLDSVDSGLLQTLYNSNCRSIFVGIESSSQNILNSVRKDYAKEILFERLRMAKETGMHVEGGFIIGLPEDNERTIKETTDLAVELFKSDLIQTPGYFLFIPWLGTYIGDNIQEFGIEIDTYNYECWNCFSPKPIASTKHVSAAKVHELWIEGLEKICRAIKGRLGN